MPNTRQQRRYLRAAHIPRMLAHFDSEIADNLKRALAILTPWLDSDALSTQFLTDAGSLLRRALTSTREGQGTTTAELWYVTAIHPDTIESIFNGRPDSLRSLLRLAAIAGYRVVPTLQPLDPAGKHPHPTISHAIHNMRPFTEKRYLQRRHNQAHGIGRQCHDLINRLLDDFNISPKLRARLYAPMPPLKTSASTTAAPADAPDSSRDTSDLCTNLNP